MKAIVYQSRATVSLEESALVELAEQFAANNKTLQVTGYLCFQRGKFFQYIEGDNEVVTDLMARIARDDLHDVMRSYADEQLASRRFPSWSMKYVQPQMSGVVSLEQIVKEHFERINASIGYEEKWVELIWSAVEKIADLQHSLGAVTNESHSVHE